MYILDIKNSIFYEYLITIFILFFFENIECRIIANRRRRVAPLAIGQQKVLRVKADAAVEEDATDRFRPRRP